MKVYIDASVFGGCFESEFKESSTALMCGVMTGRGRALISDTLIRELELAPEPVQQLLSTLIAGEYQRMELTIEAEDLRDAYLQEGVLTKKWIDDAQHVAQAVIAGADVIASWNFKHFVNPLRINGFNAVNAARGHGAITIMTPEDICRVWEVSRDGN